MNDRITDITAPSLLSMEELPALERMTLREISCNPHEVRQLLHDCVATIRHMSFETTLFRDAFIERNGRGQVLGCEKTRAAMNYLERQEVRARG
jgi:hypothetical protein